MRDHQFLQYIPRRKSSRVIRLVSLDLMNFFFQKSLSRTRWLKLPRHSIECYSDGRDPDGNPRRETWTSNSFGLRDLEQHIFETLGFESSAFNVFEPQSPWLDAVVDVAPIFPYVDKEGGALAFQAPLPLGDEFPVVPRIDREGHIYTTLQVHLQKSAHSLRSNLVANSDDFHSIEWLNTLRIFVADMISLIDITLHHIYTKAQYAPLPGWNFDLDELGVRHGRRLRDKISWVRQITGTPLDDAEEELRAFHRLRQIRNHLQHFDPPCFGFTLEDVESWLNCASPIARLAWKIRKRVEAPLTPSLVALIVAPDVRFTPKNSTARRIPQPENVGYRSTCWSTEDEG